MLSEVTPGPQQLNRKAHLRLPFGRLWYGEPNAVENAIGYAQHRSRSHNAEIRVYDASGNVIETHEHKGEFKEW
jgi:hypothetical protein